MAGQIPRHFIDDLLNRIDIVDVIEKRIKLKKSGSNHMACCPFHSEKTPSFTVSQSKQFYHCFGCGAHGSALGFLMEYEGMHFVDAVETLAESIGIEVPRESDGSNVNRDRNKLLFKLMEECADFYVSNLKNHPQAISYLKNRGMDGETAKRFAIGYAPGGWDVLLKRFPGREKELLQIGMLSRNDNGRIYDRFRERIMFPIRDRRGRVIAFGGRVLAAEEPKYLNSPETPLYHKGSELYGLFEGRRAAQDKGLIIVVEGYMDVVALSQHGIDYAVATLGTATNQQHCENIFRIVPEIVFCFDGDRAGVEAAWRALQATLPCLQDGRDAHFLFLPDGQDPDSLVNEQGKDGFLQQLASKKSIIDFLFEHLRGDADIAQIGTRARLVEKAVPLLQKMPEGVYRKLAEQKLEKLVGMPLQPRSSHSRAKPSGTRRRHNNQSSGPRPGAMSPMRRSIMLLLNHPELAVSLAPEQYDFNPEMRGAKLLLRLISIIDRNPQITIGALLEQFRDTADWPHIDKLSTTPYFPDARELTLDVATAEFAHCIGLLNQQSRPREASKLPPAARTGLLGLTKPNADQTAVVQPNNPQAEPLPPGWHDEPPPDVNWDGWQHGDEDAGGE